MKKLTRKLETEFPFAGFNWPKYCAILPRGTKAARLERHKNPVAGPYYCAPSPLTADNKGASFYLDSDFMPGLRWDYCDGIQGAGVKHSGWFIDDFQDETIRGIVFRLPAGRGFLAGWTMGESMASGVEYDIYDDIEDAAHAADSLAESVAEREREYRKKEEEERENEEADSEIVKHMALAFFGSAYADQAEEAGAPLRGEIMEQLPAEIDAAAKHAADNLRVDLCKANNVDRLAELLELAEEIQEEEDETGDRPLNAEYFGHYLAMESMGQGVGLYDAFGSSVSDKIRVPYTEFGAYSLERDYFETEEEAD